MPESDPPTHPTPGLLSRPLRVVMLYAFFSALWIILSDRLAAAIFATPEALVLVSSVKSWFFVAVSSLLLYRQMVTPDAATAAPARSLTRRPWMLMGWLSVLVVGLAAFAVVKAVDRRKGTEVARMQAVADLKARQVADWHAERMGRTRQVASDRELADRFRRWRDTGDSDSRDRVFAQLHHVQEYGGFESVALLDAQLRPLWQSDGAEFPIEPADRAAIGSWRGGSAVRALDPHGDSAGRMHVDFVASLPMADGSASPVVVLRASFTAAHSLRLSDWPLPTRSGEVVFFRRDGDSVVYLNRLRNQSAAETRMRRVSIDTRGLLAAALMRRALPTGPVLDGVDYRGVRSFGAGRRIAGTDWFLLAKMDRSEMLAPAITEVLWILMASALGLLAVGVSLFLAQHRQALAVAMQVQQADRERLRALGLLSAIADSSSDAIYAKDLDGRYLMLSRGGEHMAQTTAEKLVGRDDSALFPPDVAARIQATDRAVIAGGKPVIVEESITTPVGLVTVFSTKGPLRDETGKVIGMFGISRDITTLKQAEAALRASEQSYRMLTEQVPAIIYRAELDGSSTYVSPAVRELGYSPEEWLADPDLWGQTIHPDDRPAVYEALAVSQKSGGAFRAEYRLRTADGRWRHLRDEAAVVTDGDGKPLCLQGIMIDLTERVETEAKVRQLSQAVEQSPESIVITNAQADIEYVNEAFERTTGYAAAEVLGRNPRVLNSGHTPPERFAELWAALAEGRPWKGELHNRRKDGSEFVEFAHIAPLRQPDGAITHYVAVKEDVTEKKRLGLELDRHRHHLEALVEERTAQLAVATQRAEAASRAKSEFLANMSHEIRTPMNAIVGLSWLARREETSPRQAERLRQIESASQHLLSIITDVLDLSKIESGRMVLEETDFLLGTVFDHVGAQIEASARARGLTVRTEAAGVPPWLRGDPTRLRQALLNLASNAVKFTERGTVTLRARVLEEGPDALRVRFEVQDTGIGIAPETAAQLFQPFEQGDGGTARKYGGTGLGLAITRRLVSLMGGDTGVESALGAGSTFWFTVPLRPGQHAAPMAPLAISTEDEATVDAVAPRIRRSDPTAGTEDAWAVLRSLEPLLERDSMAANTLFDLNRPMLQAALGSTAEMLARHVNAFDYPAALRLVRDLLPPP